MTAVLVIDGRSGAGKTSRAEQVASGAEDPRFAGAQILHLEDLYPGWSGLAAGSRAVAAALRDGGYVRYDWATGEFAERVELEAGRPLIIEGCGAITAENLDAAREWAQRGVGRHPGAGPAVVESLWIECPDALRRTRARERDGDAFAPYWESWAEQEQQHLAQHAPKLRADRILHVSDTAAAG